MPSTSPTSVPLALAIGGSDSSGVAGVQADLRAFDALGVHGASVVTLVTSQGPRGMRRVDVLRPEALRAQLAAAGEPRAVKVGALGNAAAVEVVADALRSLLDAPVVLDPVIAPAQGRALLDDAGFGSLVRELLPLAALVAPNRDEAARLAGATVKTPRQARAACQAITALGAKAVLLKGGHFEGGESVDLLYDGETFTELRATRRKLPAMRGLGAALSALVVAGLAKGEALAVAVSSAHATLQRAMECPRSAGAGMTLPGDLRDAARAVREEREKTEEGK